MIAELITQLDFIFAFKILGPVSHFLGIEISRNEGGCICPMENMSRIF